MYEKNDSCVMAATPETAFTSLLGRFQNLNANLGHIHERVTGVSRRLADSLRQPAKEAPDTPDVVEHQIDVVTAMSKLMDEMDRYESRIFDELINIEKAI